MDKILKQRMIEVCDIKIKHEGTNVGLTFYAFFANKNENPQLLMTVAEWWIMTHKLDHFEKPAKLKS
jgi:hypothetical protein